MNEVSAGISSKPEEHRRAARAEVSLVARVRPVVATIDMARRLPAIGVAVLDISTLGLSFISDRHFDLDDLVEVELLWRGTELFFHGCVRHVESYAGSNSLSAIGIQFVITPSTKHGVGTLQQWLQSLSGESLDM